MPALATATSRPPKRSTVSATAAHHRPVVGDVGADPDRPLADPLGRLARLLGVEVDDRDRGAAHVHLARRLVADPAGGAGDQRHLSVQVVERASARRRSPYSAPRITLFVPGFRPVDPKQSFPELEERVLERWRERDVFHRSLANREGAEVWSFYEGPPTANGRPGSHHVLARVFKDVYPRYQTMRGYRVPRKAGWDCHGLPVELEVEKELGITSKQEIEEYGIAEFNQRCRESVFALRRGVEPADRADRLLDRPRRPLLHARQRLHRVGLVVAAQLWDDGPPLRGPQGRALLPALRHRALLATRSRRATRTSRTRRSTCASRCSDADARAGESLLVWTTTPWTLLAQRGGRGRPRRRPTSRAPSRRRGR